MPRFLIGYLAVTQEHPYQEIVTINCEYVVTISE